MAIAYGQDQAGTHTLKCPSFWQKRRVFAKTSARPTKTPALTGTVRTATRFLHVLFTCDQALHLHLAGRASQTAEELKPQGARTPTLRLSIAAHEIPHPAKVTIPLIALAIPVAPGSKGLRLQASYGGEDAFFITQQGSAAFGVADGVGGWVSSGINPAGNKIA